MTERASNRDHIIGPERSLFTVQLVSNKVMRRHWNTVENALIIAFSDERIKFLNENFTSERPIEHTREAVWRTDEPGMSHILSFDMNHQIAGGILCVPTIPNGREITDVGWFFLMPNVGIKTRRELNDAMMDKLVSTLRTAGYKRIVTEMGTKAGAEICSRYYGFMDFGQKKWVKYLFNGPPPM